VAAFGNVLSQTRVAELLDGDDDTGATAWTPGSKLMAPLMAKVDAAQKLLAEAGAAATTGDKAADKN
jgi:hypothetical protein